MVIDAMKKTNENFIHNCGGEKLKISDFRTPLTRMGFSPEELNRILDFYVFEPIVKEGKNFRYVQDLSQAMQERL